MPIQTTRFNREEFNFVVLELWKRRERVRLIGVRYTRTGVFVTWQ